MSSRRKTSVKCWNTVLTYLHENNQGIVFPYPIATNLKILLCLCVTKVKNGHEKFGAIIKNSNICILVKIKKLWQKYYGRQGVPCRAYCFLCHNVPGNINRRNTINRRNIFWRVSQNTDSQTGKLVWQCVPENTI